MLTSVLAPRAPRVGLATLLKRAHARGADTVIISSEELDRLCPGDVPQLSEALAGHQTTLTVTVTRPIHRWASGWQELVKHGLADYPQQASRHICTFASLTPGRLQELMELLPVDRRLVRLVRTSPPEDRLAADLAVALGLPGAAELGGSPPRNVSLPDVDIVRRMNELNLTIGTLHGGREVLTGLREAGPVYREAPELTGCFQPTPVFWTAASAEADYLRSPSGGVEILDPHRLLETWLDPEPPPWYQKVSSREVVIAAPGPTVEPNEQLWRERQHRRALEVKLDRLTAKLRRLEAEPASGQRE